MEKKKSLNKYFKDVKRMYGDITYDMAMTLVLNENDMLVIEDNIPPLKMIQNLTNGMLVDFEVMIMANNLAFIQDVNPEVYKNLLEDLANQKYPLLAKVKEKLENREEWE